VAPAGIPAIPSIITVVGSAPVIVGSVPTVPTPTVPTPTVPTKTTVTPGVIPATPTVPSVPAIPTVPSVPAPGIAYADINIRAGTEGAPGPWIVKVNVCVNVRIVVESAVRSVKTTDSGGVSVVVFVKVLVVIIVPFSAFLVGVILIVVRTVIGIVVIA